jgi:hypothetical protein
LIFPLSLPGVLAFSWALVDSLLSISFCWLWKVEEALLLVEVGCLKVDLFFVLML